MNRLILVTMFLVPILSFGQKKVKAYSNPIGWTYEIGAVTPIDEDLQKNKVVVITEMDPNDFWERVDWGMSVMEKDDEKRRQLYKKAVQDTITKWGTKYLAITKHPYIETRVNPDFTITLDTDPFEAQNVQLDIDYDDQESVICQLDISARLTVRTADGEVLLDEKIVYLIDDGDTQSNQLKLKHFMLNPAFKAKFRLTKRPEKKKELIERKIERFDADILEYFFVESEEVIQERLIGKYIKAYAAIFGTKDKSFAAFNSMGKSVSSAINSLNAFSKKKRKTLDQIIPEPNAAVAYWEDFCKSTNNQEVQFFANANISTVSLFLGNVEKAKSHLVLVPESKELGSSTLFEGTYKYFLKGISNAIVAKDEYKERANIWTLE